MFVTPILFSPLYVYMSNLVPGSSSWTAYVFGAITAFVFGCLQSVQDRLDDPFLGITYDEINLDDLHMWANESLKHNENRIDVIGRFTVNAKPTLSVDPEKINSKTQTEVDAKVIEMLKDHPYLTALNAGDSSNTLRISKTQEIPGRNRIIFLRREDQTPEDDQNKPPTT
ncbi:hypothetical protein RF11_09606 [Thelohanellus kitauei]|uniref:Uncharacterized protein n=1 Tax=Thelohanellus kitauei TaxID=669202 RepID=A0A0C2MMY6_THEKT|nr:hypothetical protein RF11_09606 [Thelohanellus kitauei]